MRLEIWKVLAVLALGPRANTICKNRFQALELAPADIHLLVSDQTRQRLPYSLSHDPRLAVIHEESFLLQNRRHVHCETIHAALKLLSAGKCEIVRIPRI